MPTNYTEFTQIDLLDSIRLDSIDNELDLIDCSEILIQKWKKVYKTYITFLQQDSIDESLQPALNSLSQDCSDIYGDAIHLARSMANTYDNTYLDQFDECIDNVEMRSRVDEELNNIFVSPNPSTGIFNVSLPTGFKGKLSVIDVAGHTLLNKNIVDGDLDTLDLSAYSGILFMRFTSMEGVVTVHKVIVIN